MKPPQWILKSSLVLIPLFLIGCGGGPNDTPETAEVSGVVTLDDEPLPDAEVVFQPENGRPSQAVTNEKGVYTLKYSKDINGAKIGKHTVRIKTGKIISKDDGTEEKIPEKVPEKYNAKTTLEVEVKPENEPINFDLKTK